MNRWVDDLQDEVLFEIDVLRHRSRYGKRNSPRRIRIEPDDLPSSNRRNRHRHDQEAYGNI